MSEELEPTAEVLQSWPQYDEPTLEYAKKIVESAMADEVVKSDPELNNRIAPHQAIIENPDIPAHLKSDAYTEIMRIWKEDARTFNVLESIHRQLDR